MCATRLEGGKHQRKQTGAGAPQTGNAKTQSFEADHTGQGVALVAQTPSETL